MEIRLESEGMKLYCYVLNLILWCLINFVIFVNIKNMDKSKLFDNLDM